MNSPAVISRLERVEQRLQQRRGLRLAGLPEYGRGGIGIDVRRGEAGLPRQRQRLDRVGAVAQRVEGVDKVRERPRPCRVQQLRQPPGSITRVSCGGLARITQAVGVSIQAAAGDLAVPAVGVQQRDVGGDQRVGDGLEAAGGVVAVIDVPGGEVQRQAAAVAHAILRTQFGRRDGMFQFGANLRW